MPPAEAQAQPPPPPQQQHDASAPFVPEIPEISPPRLHHTDAAGIKRQLDVEGFACVKECLNAEELVAAREMLWQHLEGAETPATMPGGACHRRERPVGWRRDDVESWVDGHGCGLMTSTVHCDAMWFTRTRRGVFDGFAAAYQERDLTAAFDRMSVNLPTATNNPAVLKKAAHTNRHGKLVSLFSLPVAPSPPPPPAPPHASLTAAAAAAAGHARPAHAQEQLLRRAEWRALHRLLQHCLALGHEQVDRRDSRRARLAPQGGGDQPGPGGGVVG
jgi:hypothetical protein